MPQMSPLMWLTLFLFFSLFYLISMIKTYFDSSLKTTSSKAPQVEKLKTNNMVWMW